MTRPKWSFLMGAVAAFLAAVFFLVPGVVLADWRGIALGVTFLLVALVWTREAW